MLCGNSSSREGIVFGVWCLHLPVYSYQHCAPVQHQTPPAQTLIPAAHHPVHQAGAHLAAAPQGADLQAGRVDGLILLSLLGMGWAPALDGQFLQAIIAE